MLVVVGMLTIISYPIHNTLIDPATYTRLIEQTGATERSRGLIADLLVSYALQGKANSQAFQRISMQSWESVAEIVIPGEWFENNLKSAIQGVLSWLGEDKDNYPKVDIGLIPIKDALNDSNGILAILPLLQNVPACQTSANYQITYFGTEYLVSCWPENKSLIEPAAYIAKSTAAAIPNSVSIESLEIQGLITKNGLEDIQKTRLGLRVWESGMRMSVWICSLLFSLYALLNSSTVSYLVKRLSLPLYLTGGLCFVFVIAWHYFIEWGIGPLMTASLLNIRIEAQNLLLDIIRELSKILEIRWLILVGVLIGSAISIDILRGLSVYLLRRKHSSVPISKNLTRMKKSFR
jgi:hypothetical protein